MPVPPDRGAPSLRARRLLIVPSVLLSTIVLTSCVSASEASPAPTPAETGSAAPTFERPSNLDALQTTRLDELDAFAAWLDANDVDGFVGEFGWPSTDDRWQTLAEVWLADADAAGISSTAWAAGSHWGSSYPLVVFGPGEGRGLGTALPQAAALTQASAPGVNLAGLEFGTDHRFSAARPGTLGTDYFAEPDSSYLYLAAEGVTTVRLPFRWERLQPRPGGNLDDDYLALLVAQLDAADAADVTVILDLHNYGRFQRTGARERILRADDAPMLADVWARLDAVVGDHPAVAAYGLMNEPHDLDADPATGAGIWEQLSSETVVELRSAGVDTELLVAGYEWSRLADWAENHPKSWITDPDENFRYEAHHYWDGDGSGTYTVDYDGELSAVGGG